MGKMLNGEMPLIQYEKIGYIIQSWSWHFVGLTAYSGQLRPKNINKLQIQKHKKFWQNEFTITACKEQMK